MTKPRQPRQTVQRNQVAPEEPVELPQQRDPPAMPWDGASDDIVADILRRVMALSPAFTAALAARVDREVRDHWGNDRPYIARRSGDGSSARNEAIRRDYRNGERMGLLRRRYGLSRQRIHQIILRMED